MMAPNVKGPDASQLAPVHAEGTAVVGSEKQNHDDSVGAAGIAVGDQKRHRRTVAALSVMEAVFQGRVEEGDADLVIHAVLGFEDGIDLQSMVMEEIISRHLSQLPRFRSILVRKQGRLFGSRYEWQQLEEGEVEWGRHVREAHVAGGEEAVIEYVNSVMSEPMDYSRPLWELHVIHHSPFNNCHASLLARIHHSMGDGFSLTNMFRNMARKADGHVAPIPLPRARPPAASVLAWLLKLLLLGWNSLAVFLRLHLTLLLPPDKKQPLKAPCSVRHLPRQVARGRVALSDLKLVARWSEATVNDVILAAVGAAVASFETTHSGAGSGVRHEADQKEDQQINGSGPSSSDKTLKKDGPTVLSPERQKGGGELRTVLPLASALAANPKGSNSANGAVPAGHHLQDSTRNQGGLEKPAWPAVASCLPPAQPRVVIIVNIRKGLTKALPSPAQHATSTSSLLEGVPRQQDGEQVPADLGIIDSFFVLPLAVHGFWTSLSRIRYIKHHVDAAKSSWEAALSHFAMITVGALLGPQVLMRLLTYILHKTTIAVSNLGGPLDRVAVGSNSVCSIDQFITGSPQGVSVHLMSYAGTMHIAVTSNPQMIEAKVFLQRLVKEILEMVKDAKGNGDVS